MSHDIPGDLIDDAGGVFDLTVVSLCPKVSSGRTIDELSGDAGPISGPSDDTLQHVPHAELEATDATRRACLGSDFRLRASRAGRGVARDRWSPSITSPSAKDNELGSPIVSNGSTAIDAPDRASNCVRRSSTSFSRGHLRND